MRALFPIVVLLFGGCRDPSNLVIWDYDASATTGPDASRTPDAARSMADAGAGSAPDAAVDAGLLDAGGGLVPAIGGPSTTDVVCWNVRQFPSTSDTPAVLADMIVSLDVDIVAIMEVRVGTTAFSELMARLPGWNGFLGEGDGYIKLALLWRTSQVTVTNPHVIFDNDYDFPRPPIVATVSKGGDTITLVSVHLKAGRQSEDALRRQHANTKIAGWLATNGNPKTLVCGDFNEDLDNDYAPDVYQSWLSQPDEYRFLTAPLDYAGAQTFLPVPHLMFDQMISTASLDGEVGGAAPFIPPLAAEYDAYEVVISDHLPVAIRLDLH